MKTNAFELKQKQPCVEGYVWYLENFNFNNLYEITEIGDKIAIDKKLNELTKKEWLQWLQENYHYNFYRCKGIEIGAVAQYPHQVYKDGEFLRFISTKEVIVSLPIIFYEMIVDWYRRCPIPKKDGSIHQLFTFPYIEKYYKYDCIKKEAYCILNSNNHIIITKQSYLEYLYNANYDYNVTITNPIRLFEIAANKEDV